MPFIWNAIRVFAIRLFTKLSGWLPELLAKFLYDQGKKFGLFLIYVGINLSLTASYFLTAHGIIAGIHKTVPQIVLDVWGWVMPYNAVPVFIALSAARILKWTYLRNKEMINKKINVMTSSGD